MSALSTLLLPFARDLLPKPRPDRAFLMRAQPGPELDEGWRAALVCEQSFKPAFDHLEAAGFATTRRLEGTFDLGLVLLTKHKAENRANLARAWGLLAPGGILVAAGDKEIGAASLEKEVDRALGLEGALAKHGARVFWLRRREDTPPPPAWAAEGEMRPMEEEGWLARPGCFSFDRLDEGSRLLAECFPEDISGRVADLGAGWGYLSLALCRRFQGLAALDLFEAEGLALEAAEANLARLPCPPPLAFHWHDVTAGLPARGCYDWIVTNPPFHEGRAALPALGQAFIAAAAAALAPGGRLLLVANRHLPYENVLNQMFRQVFPLREERGFKVLMAA